MNFDELVSGLQSKLYRFALRITGHTAEAEDVVQEVFIKLWNHRQDWENLRNAEAWCMHLTRNLSIDRYRKYQRQQDLLQQNVHLQRNVSPEEQHAQEAMDQIRQCMLQLPEKQRLIMHLRDIEGLSYEEISDTLEIPLDQVKVYLHRARQKIKESILTMAKRNNDSNKV